MKKTGFILTALVLFIALGCKQKEKTSEVKKEEVTETEKKQPLKLKDSLRFTAFKTEQKIGVNGTFTDIQLSDFHDEKENMVDLLTGANFKINTKSIYTKDPARDAKLEKFFFENLASSEITGKFKSFNSEKAMVQLEMNGIEKEIPFELNATKDQVELSGSIDMIEDFSANKAFQAIHEACKVLHEDKTWTDVDLKIIISK
ncbi:YceI family protein [Galbibacter sp. BG1]|uniref:YceI family protein n=1 Tax=Galbibacter sp. BG1 TaxID=1170699 RepID=UPI0015BC399B|nr:YceI family protein [Galbibacter sp. BG1]QLE00153.1 YceI family protein [Galbibacter sp. BG1]